MTNPHGEDPLDTDRRIGEMKLALIGRRLINITGQGGYTGTKLVFEGDEEVSMLHFAYHKGWTTLDPQDVIDRIILSDANVSKFREALYTEISNLMVEYAMDDTIFGDKLAELLRRYAKP